MIPQLEKVSVTNLFGYLTYELNDLSAERSIFVIGNNGSGKSTIFKLISALVQNKWHVFHEVKFSNIVFTFSTPSGQIEYKFQKNPNVEWQDHDGKWHNLAQGSFRDYLELDNVREKAEWIFRNEPKIKRARCGRHWATPENSHVGHSELVKYWESENLSDHLELPADGGVDSSPNMEPLENLKIQFIQANRLLALELEDSQDGESRRYQRSRNRNQPRAPIFQISDLLRSEIRNQITRAFIERDTIGNNALNKWLSQGSQAQQPDNESVHELAKKIDEIENAFSEFSRHPNRTKLMIPSVLPKGYDPFLKFYLGSRLKQLSPLTGFLTQVDLFSEICNSAFGYKKVSLHEEYGLIVTVKVGSHTEELDLSDLSSGEQQIIFLAYQLTIGAMHDALILIDEPELSLHLEWQKTFISLLDRIGDRTGNRYLCATHSPAIVGRNFDSLRYIEVSNED